ncbi:MAG: ATP-binding protein [Rickettsiales bacterium]
MIKKKLSSDFRKISITIFLFSILLSLITSWAIYSFEEDKRKKTYPEIAEHLDRELIQNFTYTEKFMISVGRNILRIGPQNLRSIFDMVHNGISESSASKEDIYSWAYLDWVNHRDKLVVNSEQGVLNRPINLSKRPYLGMSRNNPWKLIIGTPILGIPSGEYVLPGSLGVEDNNGKYIGSVVIEFSIKKIRGLLIDIASDFGCEFFILDDQKRILFRSDELLAANEDFFAKHSLGNKSGLLPDPVNFKDSVLLEYQIKSKFYPFTIILGKSTQNPFGVLIDILPKVFAILLIAVFCIYLLRVLRKSIVSAIQNVSYLVSNDGEEIEDSKKSNYQEISHIVSNISKIKNFNKALQEEVSKQTEHLKEALRTKQEFLNNISHEIRTPLQGILGISSELNKRWDSIPDSEKRNYVKIMADSGDRLMELMSNVLDLSRFSEDKIFFSFRKCNFKKIIEESIAYIRPLLAQNNKLKLVAILDGFLSKKVKCDRFRIQQVINNLLSNAIKYSSSGTIKIEGGVKKDSLLFEISDDGVGIPENEIETIFNPFVVGGNTKTKAGGKGLGLALCKQIIEAHNGKIWARNLKIGSKFSFRIPLERS